MTSQRSQQILLLVTLTAVIVALASYLSVHETSTDPESAGMTPDSFERVNAGSVAVSSPERSLEPDFSPNESQNVSDSFLQSLIAQLDALPGDNEPVRRQAELDKLASSVADKDVARVLGLLWTSQTDSRREMRQRLLRRWATESPSEAARWIAEQSSGESRQEGVNLVATAWANENIDEATTWARTLIAEDRSAALLAIAYEAAHSNPLQALQLSLELSPDESRNELIAHTARLWAASDPEPAVNWAQQIEEAPLRDEVLANMATALSENDPVAAANLALESITPGKAQHDALVSVVQRWTQKEPRAAAEWIVQFPEGDLRTAAVENLVPLWAEQDSPQAMEWLNGLPPGSLRDSAFVAFALFLSPSEPAQAAGWAGRIQDQELRQRELERLGLAWLANDPVAARDWIQTAALSPQAKSRLLSNPPAGPIKLQP